MTESNGRDLSTLISETLHLLRDETRVKSDDIVAVIGEMTGHKFEVQVRRGDGNLRGDFWHMYGKIIYNGHESSEFFIKCLPDGSSGDKIQTTRDIIRTALQNIFFEHEVLLHQLLTNPRKE